MAAPADLIAAVATAPGTAGVGIVRLSGKGAFALADALYRTPAFALPGAKTAERPSHRALYGWVVDARGERLDEVLLLAMHGPRSFTGEDVVEFQTHGGPVVLQALLSACLAGGARLAAPGEFARRAFLNGRLDLAQAEAIGDIIEAKSERGLALALAQREGGLSRAVAEARAEAIAVAARLEAAIDYPDEIGDPGPAELEEALTALLERLRGFMATAHAGRVMREGARLVLVGEPNVGKSSLLNALLGTERAIVTDVAGTTRDVLEEGVAWEGVPFRLLDTAGLRETEDAVEAIGVSRTRRAISEADVVAAVVDLTRPGGPLPPEVLEALGRVPVVLAGNKLDAAPPEAELAAWGGPFAGRVRVSARTGEGLAGLRAALAEAAVGSSGAVLPPWAVNARHQAALRQAEAAILDALEAARGAMPLDCVAIDVQAAVAALGEITGDALVEEIVEEVFERFCVGK